MLHQADKIDGEILLTSKFSTRVPISINESTSVGELFEMLLSRWLLATDKRQFSEENFPVAVLTIVVNGLNVGFDNPMEQEVAIALWDGLDEEEKIILLDEKQRHQIQEEDYASVEIFNLFKLNRIVNSFSKLLENSGESK